MEADIGDTLHIKDNITLITVYSNSGNSIIPLIFNLIAQRGIRAYTITFAFPYKSETIISFAVDGHCLSTVMSAMGEAKRRGASFFYRVKTDNARITLGGVGVCSTTDTVARVLEKLLEADICPGTVSIDADELSVFVDEAVLPEAIAKLKTLSTDEKGVDTV